MVCDGVGEEELWRWVDFRLTRKRRQGEIPTETDAAGLALKWSAGTADASTLPFCPTLTPTFYYTQSNPS